MSFKYTFTRGQWVPPAPAITGVPWSWSQITTVAIHYTAAANVPDGDIGEDPSQVPVLLRAIQNDYVKNRGYSIGYNAAVDWLGRTFELRSWDFKCAANAGSNETTFAILVFVDGAGHATEAQAEGIRGLVAEVERRAGRKLAIKGHGQLPGARTACPGVGLLADISAGKFVPVASPVVVPPVDVEDDMRTAMMVQVQGYPNVFLVGVGAPVHLTPEMFAHCQAAGVPVIQVAPHAQFMKSILFQTGLTMADLGS